MNKNKREYYVYVYIDPRNFEEFYYGKGKDNRKDEHLNEKGESKKNKRIKAIKEKGLKPIIKIIAKDLTENEAYLVEKTLIWKLSNTLDNISTGHYSENFRPHNTMHENLKGFDYKNGLFNLNIGEGAHRCWEDCMKYGFISAGQGLKWSKQLESLNKGDIITAYLSSNSYSGKNGYVGIGRITETIKRIEEFKYNGQNLRNVKLAQSNILENSDNEEKSEYLVKIEWIKSVEDKNAKWKSNYGLYSTQLIKSSLSNQPKTIEFLENEFDISFSDLLIKNEFN